MTLCSNGHDEIVHDDSSCPACRLQDVIETLVRRIELLEEAIENTSGDADE